ncbi:MAG: NUDIX domain-containing protein [Hyphomonadaceae bacterium]
MKRDDIAERARRTLHEGRLKVVGVTLDAPSFAGARIEIDREIAARPDSASALVHDIERDVFILAEQLRVPAYERGGAWLTELVAGKIDGDETPEACIRREIEEEIGYSASGKLEPIAVYFSAPGYSTERVHLFYAPVTSEDLVRPDAAGVDPGEDIQRFEIARTEFLDRLDKRDFQDGKILALAGWALKRFG